VVAAGSDPVSWPLVLAGLAMGLAASPHCAAMCGAPCAALSGGCRQRASTFHLGRLLGYMAGGAVAAGGVAWLGAGAAALRPLWSLLHLGFLAIGLWWAYTGRHPEWLMRRAVGGTPITLVGPLGARLPAWRPGLAGLAWVAWPCAALQGALLLSALAPGPVEGAMVMAGFAVGSMPALAAAPWAWARWQSWLGRAGAPQARQQQTGFRIAGGVLALSSGWALGHGVWARVASLCAS